MPTGGFKHPRVWKSLFPRPIPGAVLDRDWDRDNRVWARGVVEKIRRGEAAPRGLSLTDLLTTDQGGYNYASGWNQAEEYAKNANRTNAVFLSDEAIARRLPEREMREKAYKEYLDEWAIRSERIRLRQEEEEKERIEVARQDAIRAKARKEEKERRDKEWAEWRKECAERRQKEMSAEKAAQHELQAILGTKWQCKCGYIVNISVHHDDVFLTWCPRCEDTKHVSQQRLADRLYGRS